MPNSPRDPSDPPESSSEPEAKKMGCTQSKIENEEAVSRCKERKQFMKEAVSARNAFAAAHSAYAMYLKNTGAALNDYAEGEVEKPLLLPHHQPSLQPAPAPVESFPPPPPPPGSTVPPIAPLQRAITMPEMLVPQNDPKPNNHNPNPVIEEEDENEIEDDESMSGLIRRRRGGGGGGGSSRGAHSNKKEAAAAAAVVDDDDGPPPVPPSPRRTHPPSPPRQGDTNSASITYSPSTTWWLLG